MYSLNMRNSNGKNLILSGGSEKFPLLNEVNKWTNPKDQAIEIKCFSIQSKSSLRFSMINKNKGTSVTKHGQCQDYILIKS